MQSTKTMKASLSAALLAGLTLSAGSAQAADVDVFLQAQYFQKTLSLDSGDVMVDMWGFASCTDDTYTSCDLPAATDAPGPQINAAEGDSLTIHLNNTLPTPVSIVIPGQAEADPGEPVMAGGRVQSFTHETAAGGSSTYEWPAMRAGTYLYQSGTHPSIQVPMGLYGALVVDSPATAVVCASGSPAYDDADSCHDDELVMLFSEIDPIQNALVQAAGSVAAYPSTIDYSPSFMLVNGGLSADLSGIGDDTGTTPEASTVLLRMLNAGSHSHTPAIVGLDMTLLAEDGYVYPGLPRVQAEALLPAGKTMDAIIQAPAANQTFSLYDRTPDFTNNEVVGGLSASVIANGGSPDPGTPTTYAVDDMYAVVEDTPYSGATVLGNDVMLPGGATAELVSGPSHAASFTLNGDGTFDYTPAADFSGSDSFTYAATDGTDSYPANVTLSVSFVNDDPVAVPDGPYSNTVGTTITVGAVNGVLGNDVDVDGDMLTAVAEGALPAGLTLNTDGSFEYTGGSNTSFQYRANDGTATSNAITVDLQGNTPSGIALTVIDPDGTAITQYRWLVQEDATYHVNPDTPAPLLEQQSLNFHKSTMPVVAQGCLGCANPTPFSEVSLDPAKHYYVSVLPNDAGTGEGHTIGGSPLQPGQTAVTVLVNKQEIPTSQVGVIVFEDNYPTNGVPDPNEDGLGGFQIILEDAGGRYGVSGGTMLQNAFGEPLSNSLLGTPGCPGSAPSGIILTCPDGTALIKDLPPAKYGIFAVAPSGGETWIQTSTIEGTKIIDAWVEAGNPPFFSEFGVPAYHAFIGFVNPANTVVPPGPPGQQNGTITGNVTLMHESRPPNITGADTGSYDALSFTRAWIGLNSAAGGGPNIATVRAEPDGSFEITGIPDGTYQLAIWDDYLDQILAYQTVILPGGGDAGNIPVNAWFTRFENNIFLDTNQNGVLDEGETPLQEQNVNLRWRDGTVNQTFPTDSEGFLPFDEVFPFFHWQVVEVDYARFKPTGVTVTVDAGGDVSGGPFPGILSPQIQTEDCTPGSGCESRTETGPVLTQAFQGFPGQTSVFDWGKVPYEPGENGGIAGIVYYASTRGENDPRLTVGDPWEPGIANVKVRLYKEVPTDFEGTTGLVLIEETTTDSWDASVPVNCPGEVAFGDGDPFVDETLGESNVTRCYDGWRNWNQVRPGVFDGGYAFGADGSLEPGTYIVEVVVPPGYELYTERDVNVGFGDSYGPNNSFAPVSVVLPNGMLALTVPDQAMIEAISGPGPGIAQPPCVGLLQDIPEDAELSLFPGEPAPFAGSMRHLCDRKRVRLADQGQSAADFHLFTSTPVAAQFTGLITDDIATETNAAAPGFGEKWSPAYMPFVLRDFNGHVVYKGNSDAFGHYNGLGPSTYTANVPIPSGYSPSMLLTCLNDSGDVVGTDPYANPAYPKACYTLQFMPGTSTYLDTPILPNAAFAAGYNPVDCACTEGTPVINQVNGTGAGPLVAPGGTLTIESAGMVEIPNPEYEGPLTPGIPPTIMRNYGFGAGGTLTLDGDPLAAGDVTWGDGSITWNVPASFPEGEYQLVVTSDNGKSSKNAVTVIVGPEDASVHRVTPAPYPATPIQDAIDAANAGDLILVAPGTYQELVILWKPVRLQGAGPASFIDAAKTPNAILQTWRLKISALLDNGDIDLAPGQPADFNLVGGGLLGDELGAGITVVAKADGTFGSAAARIDGLGIHNADGGGGIFVNAYAHNLEISNNEIADNSGVVHGGIRVGHPFLLTGPGPYALNTGISIHHNSITKNGGMQEFGAGGGVSINAGSDGYEVSDNYVCGNFKLGDGGGVAHFGLSDNGLIQRNEILFNQSFNQGLTRNGGGLFIGGEPPADGALLTAGAGDVTVDANLIQGNAAGSGHGAGLRAQSFNGLDVDASNQSSNWWELVVTNNMIVNNVAGWSGGGISLQDTVNARIVMNTIANNDSTATVGAVLDAAGVSTPQPAGISSERNSLALDDAIPGNAQSRRNFSNPELTHNIIWHNRAFYFNGNQLMPNLTPTAGFGCPAGANYVDLGVLDAGFSLSPRRSILSSTAGYPGNNSAGDPAFLSDYCNGSRTLQTIGPMSSAPAVGEGGNFVDVRYGPLTQAWPAGSDPWDYHITDASAALDYSPSGPSTGITTDFDGQPRPTGPRVDLGADELVPPGTTPPTGPLPGIVTFSSGDFGVVPVNSTAQLVVTATVPASSPAAVSFGTSTDPAPPFAKAAGGDGCVGSIIAPGGSCSYTLTYSPTAVPEPPASPTDTGSFQVNSNADGDPLTVQLTGTPALPGVVEIAGASFGSLGGGTLNFGNLSNGNYNSTVTLAVNEATAVTFGTLSKTGGRFSLVGADTCSGATVASGSSCSFTVRFNANGNATRTGSVSFPHDGGGPTSLALTGQ